MNFHREHRYVASVQILKQNMTSPPETPYMPSQSLLISKITTTLISKTKD